MIDPIKPLTAKAKLALSRAELVAATGYEEVKSATHDAVSVLELPRSAGSSSASAIGAKVGRSVAGRWWHRHPLSSVFQLGQPLLERYAQRHPGKLIAYGAGTGAMLWIVKPWKLLSAATVVTLIVRTSDISGIVSDVVKKATGAAEDNVASGVNVAPRERLHRFDCPWFPERVYFMIRQRGRCS
jgi:hypothetical protein